MAIFKKKTVAGIMGQFEKAVVELKGLIENRTDENIKIGGEIIALEARATDNSNEIAKAKAITKNLQGLLGK